jgi:hypothetical protein
MEKGRGGIGWERNQVGERGERRKSVPISKRGERYKPEEEGSVETADLEDG